SRVPGSAGLFDTAAPSLFAGPEARLSPGGSHQHVQSAAFSGFTHAAHSFLPQRASFTEAPAFELDSLLATTVGLEPGHAYREHAPVALRTAPVFMTSLGTAGLAASSLTLQVAAPDVPAQSAFLTPVKPRPVSHMVAPREAKSKAWAGLGRITALE